MSNTSKENFEPYLKEFSVIADNWFEERHSLIEFHQFIKDFFSPEKLKKAEWADFQSLGGKLHCFNSNPLAKANAFGRPNYPIDMYRDSFDFLAHGEGSVEDRTRKFMKDNKAYASKQLGPSAVSELLGQLFGDKYVSMNKRDESAVEALGIKPMYKRGDDFSARFIKFNEALIPLIEAYKRIVKARTEAPIGIEVDQFLSWVSEKNITTSKSDNSPEDSTLNQVKEFEKVDFTLANITVPLNQILYGPPGTGKTFNTINKSLEILDPALIRNHSSESEEDRYVLKKRFDVLVESGHISFVTFHQSFSYEDFVEGLRPVTGENGGVTYEVVAGVFKKLCEKAKQEATKPCVIIIDEINRGNISRIFGELITLIEKNKRAGELEELEVILPYSKDNDNKFSIPSNVYIIGTMNSADRSLTGVDIALRRRFSFIEMPPEPHLLVEKNVDDVKINELLKVMNERIEVLYDRDHCLGHSYFMSLHKDSTVADLGLIFQESILPLLREYFFDDWERIRWVLNDHRKEEKYQFLQTSTGNNTADFTKISQLFGDEISGKLPDRRWRINQPAFKEIDSYRGILNPDKPEDNSGGQE